MTPGEWIALAGVVVAAAGVLLTVIGGIIWIVVPLTRLTTDVTHMRIELAKVMAFNDSRPCDNHEEQLKDIQSEVGLLRKQTTSNQCEVKA